MVYAIETTNLGMMFVTNWGGKKRALQNLSLQINRNEIFGFLGHNGAGKTTTIKILVGICHPTEGHAQICGIPITDVSSRARVGFLPEDPYFYEYLTGLESIEFYGHLHGISRKECRKRAEQILDDVGLTHAIDRRVRVYSKGMKQRLGLAQAMIHDPEILILDEPLTGLDPVGRREIREKIRQLKDKGKTVFFSSHVLNDVELLCDRVALLSQGNLISIGSLDTLLDPKIISIEIVAENVPEQTIEQISPQCKRVIREGKKLALVVNEETVARAIKDTIEKNGGLLKAFIPNRESLEDFYFRQAKGESR